MAPMKRILEIIAGLAAATLVAAAQDVVQIDFRNYIPGVLDAPVFYPDGVTRIAFNWTPYKPYASLWFSKASNDPPFSSFTRASDDYLFQGSTNAGYWVPTLAVLPDVKLGEHISVLVRAGEMTRAWTEGPIWGRQGLSKVLSLVVTNPVMTLVGLESFRLQGERFRWGVQDGQMVLSWYHGGASTYWVESTENLAATSSWVTVFTSSTEQIGSTLSVTNPIVGPQRFYRLRRWPLP
jgi:hypothetical protein